MPGPQRELPNELTLCPSVTFPKQMNRIDLPKIERRPLRKPINGRPSQKAFALQGPQSLGQRTHQVHRRTKRSGLRDIHHAKLPRPGKHVLKKITMDRPQMRNIEDASYPEVFQFAPTFSDKNGFNRLKVSVVCQSKTIARARVATF